MNADYLCDNNRGTDLISDIESRVRRARISHNGILLEYSYFCIDWSYPHDEYIYPMPWLLSHYIKCRVVSCSREDRGRVKVKGPLVGLGELPANHPSQTANRPVKGKGGGIRNNRDMMVLVYCVRSACKYLQEGQYGASINNGL